MSEQFDGWTLEQEWIKCGKASCGSCPHGPYWYGYRKEGKKTKKKYFGKKKPVTQEAPKRSAPKTEKVHPHDKIFDRRGASASLAAEILGVSTFAPFEEIKSVFRRLLGTHHPDRGGDPRTAQRITAAFDYLRSLQRAK